MRIQAACTQGAWARMSRPRAGLSLNVPSQSIALKFRLAPSLMPEGQRAVTVLVRV